ncbi:hypothetical protein CFOL_v3_01287 [Cephalotus follicularis]|uniref:Uncharacterized protein n=1 Tax=Cephalotus follicularis TaxID=3775 RepID=A0A1Q3APT0_CEPFO|nr:hypothetical protein CFOL_v3_01287 [Cephalotus follicularis]
MFYLLPHLTIRSITLLYLGGSPSLRFHLLPHHTIRVVTLNPLALMHLWRYSHFRFYPLSHLTITCITLLHLGGSPSVRFHLLPSLTIRFITLPHLWGSPSLRFHLLPHFTITLIHSILQQLCRMPYLTFHRLLHHVNGFLALIPITLLLLRASPSLAFQLLQHLIIRKSSLFLFYQNNFIFRTFTPSPLFPNHTTSTLPLMTCLTSTFHHRP